MSINSRNFWFWFGGIWLGVGLPFLLLGVFFAWNELTLEPRLARATRHDQWVMPFIFCVLGAMLTLLGGFVLLKAISAARFVRGVPPGRNTSKAKVERAAIARARPARLPDAARPATQSDPTERPSRLMDFLRLVYRIAGVLLLVFCAAVVGELLPGLKPLDAWMRENELMSIAITGGAAAFGVFLLIGSVLSMLMDGGAAMNHREVEDHQRSMRDAFAGPRTWRVSAYRLRGRGAGSQGHDEFSFAQLKGAFASGAVLRTRLWRRRLCAVCGGMFIFFGVFGTAFVLAPMPVKVIVGAAVGYACVRIAWGLARA